MDHQLYHRIAEILRTVQIQRYLLHCTYCTAPTVPTASSWGRAVSYQIVVGRDRQHKARQGRSEFTSASKHIRTLLVYYFSRCGKSAASVFFFTGGRMAEGSALVHGTDVVTKQAISREMRLCTVELLPTPDCDC